MKIAIDTSSITTSKAGIGHYTFELVKNLIQTDQKNHYLLYTHNKNFLEQLSNQSNVTIIELAAPRPSVKWIIKVWRNLKKEKVDLLISPSNFLFPVLFSKSIQIVHDVIPVSHPQFWPKKAALMFKYQLKLAATRKKVIFATTAQANVAEINKYIPKTKGRVFVIGSGIMNWQEISQVSEQKKSELEARLSLPDKYILTVGTLQPRKNYITMIKAFSEFLKTNPDYHYVIVGQQGWYFAEIFELVRELKLEDKIKFFGYAKDEEILIIYKNAKLFLYMSLVEGYALPCLEAYSYGLKILASDIPVIKEVMQDKILLANPLDHLAIASKLTGLIKQNSPEIDTTFLKSFDWKVVATRFIALYTKIAP